MGYTLSYRTCQPISPEQETAIRLAAASFNHGRTWVLTFLRDERDDHLICGMKPTDMPDGDPAAEKAPKWPGPYEAKCLLDGLCGISRGCKVDWEIHATYSLRPVGIIHGGECHSDPKAHAEAVRNLGEALRRGAIKGEETNRDVPVAPAPASPIEQTARAKPHKEARAMRSLPEAKELLARLCGFQFPDSLFLVHEFLAGLGAAEREHYYSALGMWPIGPLEVLSLPEAEIRNLKPTLPLVLHWRFYRDVPEFFSCLKGDQDWLRWGLLLDEPAKGFRGVASYYHHDTSPISVYPSLFSAVLKRIEYRTDTSEPADAGAKADHREQQEHLRRFSAKIHGFIEERRIPLDDGRGKGFPSDTGLDLLVAEKGEDWFSSILDWFSRWPRSDWSVFPPTGHPQAVHFGEMKEAREIKQLVRKAVVASEKGRALPALSLGRSLWYYGVKSWLVNSSDYASVAYDLLKRAYTLLDRPVLLRVLDMHFEHRV